MIQCVDSRNDAHPYCSRVCCSAAIKNALELKKQKPKAKVVVLYKDIRTYGFREQSYQQAREAGVPLHSLQRRARASRQRQGRLAGQRGRRQQWSRARAQARPGGSIDRHRAGH